MPARATAVLHWFRRTLPRSLPLALLAGAAAAGGCARDVDVSVSQRFAEAGRIFDRASGPEDHLRAASIYESILEDGVRSGAVLYNLGNAYWMAERRGEAIAAYRRALRYRPRDPYVHANLLTALGRSAEEEARRRPLVDLVLFWGPWLSYPETSAGVVALAALAAVLSLAGRLAPSNVRGLGRAAWIAIGFAALLSVTAALDAWRIEFVRHGVVTAEVLARKGNSDTYEPAFTEPLPEGEEFVVVERRGEWLRIRLEGNLDGWIPADRAVTY